MTQKLNLVICSFCASKEMHEQAYQNDNAISVEHITLVLGEKGPDLPCPFESGQWLSLWGKKTHYECSLFMWEGGDPPLVWAADPAGLWTDCPPPLHHSAGRFGGPETLGFGGAFSHHLRHFLYLHSTSEPAALQ